MDFEPFDVEVPVEMGDPGDEEKIYHEFLVRAVRQRDAAIDMGFSPEAAEALAVHLHSGLVARYFTQ